MHKRPLFKATDVELVEKFHKVKDFETLADLLEFNAKGLERMLTEIKRQEKHYKEFYIKKKSGEDRQILVPDYKLMLVQRRLAHILSLIYIGRASVNGFRQGKSIITNAERHIRRKALLNIDLKDFFPTIHFGRIRGILQVFPYKLPKNGATIIAGFCCYKSRLPQGAPTSPVISNIICSKLDYDLQQLSYEEHCTYSRYVDDITFSTTSRNGFSQNMFGGGPSGWAIGEKLNEIIARNGFNINPRKTRMRFLTERQEVTGLVVNKFPNIKRGFVKEVRMMLHIWKKFGIEMASEYYATKHWSDFYESLRGKINFIKLIKTKRDSTYRNLAEKFNVLNGQTVFEIVPIKNWPEEGHFKEGSLYKATEFLSAVFDCAEQEIFILDNYFMGSIVSLLEKIFLKNNSINFKILISKRNQEKYKECIVVLKQVVELHPKIKIDCRESLPVKEKKSFRLHDRYIIIDEAEVYHSGHSFGQLGQISSSSIIRMRAPSERKDVLDDLKSQFDDAKKISLVDLPSEKIMIK
jgi:RNA-directed DNA polymerase